ncbi:hypothetical protein FN846DRAFT_972512 [Sphaerosporella brunnea]|uniref:Uncharacterized protein n=1 Tax=Sphaerosporella brunnea TaxID=1250544 RepID=A0A5J5EIC5_9PEZI|nr:hypothetical protein FN846DRAFT_972512 [Sphaerosporella brunnea]
MKTKQTQTDMLLVALTIASFATKSLRQETVPERRDTQSFSVPKYQPASIHIQVSLLAGLQVGPVQSGPRVEKRSTRSHCLLKPLLVFHFWMAGWSQRPMASRPSWKFYSFITRLQPLPSQKIRKAASRGYYWAVSISHNNHRLPGLQLDPVHGLRVGPAQSL